MKLASADAAAFAGASGDHNPLHLDASAGRMLGRP
ncbi:MaoC/PaaZ C-terminal domain-containing protein [Streptomyces sp. NPDC091371]